MINTEFYEKYKKYIYIIVIIAIVVIFIVLSKNSKKAKDSQRAKELAESGAKGFNPRPFTDSIWNDCYTSYTSDTSLYSDMVKLPDESIKAIFLDWNERYQNKKENGGKSLANAVYTAYSGFFTWNWSSVEPFYNKLKSLGLE